MNIYSKTIQPICPFPVGGRGFPYGFCSGLADEYATVEWACRCQHEVWQAEMEGGSFSHINPCICVSALAFALAFETLSPIFYNTWHPAELQIQGTESPVGAGGKKKVDSQGPQQKFSVERMSSHLGL